MKNIASLFIAFCIATAGVFLLASRAQAVETVPLSDEHKARIVAHCTSVKSSLQQLHRSDASLRVNRGQLYEFISTKLMARLNSRLVLNKLDASDLVVVTARYEKGLTDFRGAYQVYEEQLSALLRGNCQKQPEEFYYQVLEVREKRQAVTEATTEVERQIAEYYQTFEHFSEEFRTPTTGKGEES